MAGKRHASEEITAKLAQANELAAKGKTQREISKALGVSIMTYHRWKKMLGAADDSSENAWRGQAQVEAPDDTSPEEAVKRLTFENSQLRRLLTDMLLEKLKLEDELRTRREPRLRQPGKGK
jgi:putative transposase